MLPLPPAAAKPVSCCILQALPEGCPSYLGVAAGCGGDPAVRLYAADDPAGTTKWRLTKIH